MKARARATDIERERCIRKTAMLLCRLSPAAQSTCVHTNHIHIYLVFC